MTSLQKPKVLVCQHGARHRYLVPRLLEQADMLAAVYTDSSACSILGKATGRFRRIMPSSIQRLAGREIIGVPRSRIFSSDAPLLYETFQRLLGKQKQGLPQYLQRHGVLSKRMKTRGVQDANVIYSMYYENLDFIRWAKGQGLKSVVDVYVSPLTDEIMETEQCRFPDWGPPSEPDFIAVRDRLWREISNLADVLICPSDWVAEGVAAKNPQDTHKIRIVPYGCSIDYAGRSNCPVEHRILFAGEDVLRKGLHYLAEATAELRLTFPDIDVRVAGLMPPEVLQNPLCRHLNFLGKLSRAQMQEEYLSADVFVLPSLSEGFAGVVAEAIVAGCPIITTRQAGSPIINEREGLLVPAGDAEALTAALERMLSNRPFRNATSANCLKQASFYSHDHWRARLVECIQEVMS